MKRVRRLVAGAALLWASGAAQAQAIDMAPLCAQYANQPLALRNGLPVAYSCEQLRGLVDAVSVKDLELWLLPMLPYIGLQLELFMAELEHDGFTCLEPDTSAPLRSAQCNGQTRGGHKVHVAAKAGRNATVEEITLMLIDMRPFMISIAQALGTRLRDVNLNALHLTLDILAAKSAALGLANAEMTRNGDYLRIRLFSLSRPRPATE